MQSHCISTIPHNEEIKRNAFKYVRFKVLTAVTILIMFFWVKAPRGLVGRTERFEEASSLHLQDWSDEPNQ
jgi:hypothetical protein